MGQKRRKPAKSPKVMNVEDRVVQEMMRHASPRLLDRYVQTLEGAKRRAQEQLVGSIVGQFRRCRRDRCEVLWREKLGSRQIIDLLA